MFDSERGEPRNEISPTGAHAIRAKVYYAESWFDQNEAIILDYRETSLVAHWIRDEIRLVARLYRGIFWGEHKVLNFACILPHKPLAADGLTGVAAS
jgi:hypothetical protein